jgi:UPF0755 protein
MTDDLESGRAEPVAVGPPRRRMSRAARARAERQKRRRRLATALSMTLLVLVVLGLVFVGSKMWHSMSGGPTDYTGDGVDDVVIQIHDGDSTTAVGETLVAANVVATTKSFVDAAAGSEAIAAIQPGFYRVRTEIPAALAVEKLSDPSNRVGKLTVPEGRQLDDIADVKTKAVTDGVFTLISKATCVELNGEQRCVPAEDLKQAASTASLEELRVPEWAADRVTAMGDDHRRIEGLIAPGTWNVDPDGTPVSILASLIGSSTTHYANRGLLETARTLDMSPYDVLVVGSLVQKEATPEDYAKVARVIYNRLAVPQRLEFDSTVNYSLDRQEIATTDADRARVTPWNTYASEGLPATPVGAPGDPALDAAEHPAPGDWLYFVTIDMQGTTLFTKDYEQHLANIEVAQRNGVLDSAR